MYIGNVSGKKTGTSSAQGLQNQDIHNMASLDALSLKKDNDVRLDLIKQLKRKEDEIKKEISNLENEQSEKEVRCNNLKREIEEAMLVIRKSLLLADRNGHIGEEDKNKGYNNIYSSENIRRIEIADIYRFKTLPKTEEKYQTKIRDIRKRLEEIDQTKKDFDELNFKLSKIDIEIESLEKEKEEKTKEKDDVQLLLNVKKNELLTLNNSLNQNQIKLTDIIGKINLFKGTNLSEEKEEKELERKFNKFSQGKTVPQLENDLNRKENDKRRKHSLLIKKDGERVKLELKLEKVIRREEQERKEKNKSNNGNLKNNSTLKGVKKIATNIFTNNRQESSIVIRQKLKLLNQEIKEIKKSLDKLSIKIEEVKKTLKILKEIQKKIKTLNSQLEVKKQDKEKNLLEEKTNLTNTIKQLQNQINELKKQITFITINTLGKLAKMLKENQGKLLKQEKEKDDLLSRKKNIENEIKRNEQESKSLNMEKRNLEEWYKKVKNTIFNKINEIFFKEEKVISDKVRQKGLDLEKINLSASQSSERSLDMMQNELNKKEKELFSLEKEVSSIKVKLKRLKREFVKIQEQIEQLNKQYNYNM